MTYLAFQKIFQQSLSKKFFWELDGHMQGKNPWLDNRVNDGMKM